MTEAELRRKVRTHFPHIKIKVRTVSFEDLARASRKTVKIIGERNQDELETVNNWATQAAILPDTSIRFYE